MSRRRRHVTLNKTRGWLYLTAQILGDVQAVRRGRVGRRLARRLLGRLAGRLLGAIFRH